MKVEETIMATTNAVKPYLTEMMQSIEECEVTTKAGVYMTLEQGADEALNIMRHTGKNSGKIVIIGNGGSAAIADHIKNDLSKCNNMRAMVFTDTATLTAWTNDEGYDIAFAKQLRLWGEKGDLLIAISSSGMSRNILNAVAVARNIGMTVVTFSGFKKENALREIGDINFFIPSLEYGIVECSHATLCHYLTDKLGEM